MTALNYANPVTPAQMDNDHHALLRENILTYLRTVVAPRWRPGYLVLDVAPQVHAGIRPHLDASARVETLDLDPASGATHILDLCKDTEAAPVGRFDMIVCTEVIEHTLDPFRAVLTLERMLKPGATLFVSTPFNFRIHGPLPDCWRFTEHGLRALFSRFEIESITALETPGRPLMPIQYTSTVRKPSGATSQGE